MDQIRQELTRYLKFQVPGDYLVAICQPLRTVFLYLGHEITCDVELESGIQLPDTGRASDVDFGKVVTDHVDARKQAGPAGAARGQFGRRSSGRARSRVARCRSLRQRGSL